ncbi:MAG: hypothetical protein KTR33_03935 [Gammaproteobacteria bacterium]|nr:hypothetical protein [Gammaproteobacteria bacterium]
MMFHPDFLGETARRINLQHYPDVRQFVVQHLYPDTLRLLLLLHEYVPLHCVIGIGYSGNNEVVEKLAAAGIRVLTPAYDQLEKTVSDELEKTLRSCVAAGQRLLIHEVGGIAVRCLHQYHESMIGHVAGAVEITKQGVWEAQKLPELKIPQVNCAQTRLKQIEGKMVGEAVVSALDIILRELGYATVGRQALVLGYGWVGKGTATSLKQRGMQVTIYDEDIIQCVDAAVDGYQLLRLPSASLPEPMTQQPAIVIGASGFRSIDAALLDKLPHRCFIASGASKDHEIDLEHLQKNSRAVSRIHRHVEAHELKDGKTIFLINKGFPVNFTSASVPDEIVEFLFAELIMLIPFLLEQNLPPDCYPLPEEQEKLAAQIWLELR